MLNELFEIVHEINLSKMNLDILKKFIEVNQYPKRLFKEIIKQESNQQEVSNKNTSNDIQDDEREVTTLCLPYVGDQGIDIINKMKKTLKKSFKDKVKVQMIYNAKKLGSRFKVKDKTMLEQQHNVVWHTKCGNKKCSSHYIRETKRRLIVRASDHNKKDNSSHLLKHAKDTRHRRVWLTNFKVLGQGYKIDFKRRISEALFIKEHKPNLSIQKDTFKLSLFN